MLYNIRFVPHKRTGIQLFEITSCIVEACNKQSAKELGQSIVRDYYEAKGFNDLDYMSKQYKYIIEKE